MSSPISEPPADAAEQAMTVLALAPDETGQRLLAPALSALGAQLEIIEDPARAAQRLGQPGAAPVVLCLIAIAEHDELEALTRGLGQLSQSAGDIPVVVVNTGHTGLDRQAVIEAGGWDIVAGDDSQAIAPGLRSALEIGRLRHAQATARARQSDTARHADLNARLALHRTLEALADDDGPPVALVFLAIGDIDSFQARLGLAGCDRVLQQVSIFLLDTVRAGDRCFRFDSGEYVLLVERATEAEIAAFIEQLHVRLPQTRFGETDRTISLHSSIAYTTLTRDAVEDDQRLATVMTTARQMRDEGYRTWRECNRAVEQPVDESDIQNWSPRLQKALADDRFRLMYQAVRSLGGDGEMLFDAVLRFLDEQDQLIRAKTFVPAAEKAGLMLGIDRWVVKNVIEVISQQRAEGNQVAVFLKLSGTTIAAGEEFRGWLQEAIKARPVAPGQLIFSLREDESQAHSHAARYLASELDALGFRIALTHYDNSQAAANLAARLPLAFIKLAPDFARKVLDGSDLEQLSQLAANAGGAQVPLIAEQIEDANSMARLWRAGVQYVQGNFIEQTDTNAVENHAPRSR